MHKQSLRRSVAVAASLFALTACSDLKKLSNFKMPEDTGCNEYIENEQWPAAIACFTEQLEKQPNDAKLLAWRGYCYEQANNHHRAIEDTTKALTLDPSIDSVYDSRANAYRMLKVYKNAIKDFTAEIKVHPDDADSYVNRAGCYDDMKDFKDALKDYDKAIEIDSNSTVALNNRGWVYLEQKDYQKAIEDFDACLQQDEKYTNAYYNRAAANIALGKLDEALVDMKHLSSEDASEVQTSSTRGFIYLLKKAPEKALKEFTDAVDRSADEENSLWAKIYCYLTYRFMKQPDKAERILKDSIAEAPGNNWPYAVLLYLNGKIGDTHLLELCSNDDERSDARLVISLSEILAGENTKAKENMTWLKDHAMPSDRAYFVAVAALKDPSIFRQPY